MARRLLLILSLFLLSISAVAEDLVPRERTAIFPAEKAANLVQSVCYSSPSGITGYWTPNEEDLKQVEDTLVTYLKSKKVDTQKKWSGFRRQVAGVKKSEESFLFIYYFYYFSFHDDTDSWKRHPYYVNDGGSDFFRVLYDMKKKCFVWFECNGEA